MGDKSKEICISIDDVRRYMGEETSDLVKKFFKSEPKVEKKHDKDIDQNDKTKIQNIQSQECVLRNDRQKQREEIINQLVAQKHDGALSLRREEEEFQKLQMLETDFRNESMRLEKERLSVADGMKNAKKEEIEGLERQISQDLLQLEEQKNRIEEELSKKRTHIGSLRQNIRQVEKEIAENEVQRKADVDLAVHRQANTMDERQKQYLKHTSDYTHRVAENRAYALAAEQEKRLLESGDTKIFSHLVANPAKHSDLFTSEHVKLSKSDMHDIGGYSDEKGKVDNKQLLSELGIVNPELQAKLSENGLKQNADRLKSLKQEIHQANIANELELLNKQNGEAETPVVSSEFDSVGKGIAERLYNLKNGIPVDQPVSKDKPGKLLNMNDQLEMWLSDNGGHILNEKQQRGLSESTTGGAMQTPSSSSLQVGRVNAEPTLLSNVISSSTVLPVPTSRGGPLLTLEDMQAEIERLREEKRSKYLSELDRKEVEERGMKGRQVNHLNDIEDEPYFKAVRRHRGRQRGKGRRNKRSYDDSSSDGCSNGDEHGDMPNVLSNRSRSGGRKRRHRRDIPVNAYNQNQLGYEQAVLSQQYPMGAQLMSQYPPPMQAPPWQWNQQMHPWLQPQQAMHAPQQHFQPQLCVQQQQQQQPPSIKGAPVDNYPVLKSARDLETNDPFQNQSSNPVGAVNARKGAPLRLTRQEIKHQSELQALQFEMELLQKKQELETYRETLEKERLARLHEAEHAQWLGTQQHELQQIKMKQAIAKEQKKLNLQLKDGGVPLTNDNTEAAMDKPDLETGVKPSAKSPVPVADGLELLKMEAGVNATNGGGKNIPTDLLKGLIVFVDGLILPDMDVLKNSLGNANVSDEADDMYRVALGLYDSKGKNITRLNASEWLPIAPTTVTSNAPEQVFCLKQSASRKLKKFDPSVLKSGSKALVEIQTKNSSSATVTQNSLGWGIIPIFTEWSGDRENKGEPKPLYLNSGLWRAALRKGIPDGSKELTSKADGVINGWILFRVCDASDSSYANTWSLLNTITSIGSVIPTAAVAKSVYVDPYGIDGLEASKAVEESPTPVRNTTGTPRLKRVPSISRVSTQGSSGGTRSGSRSSELTESRLKERADKFATPPRSEEGNSVTSLSSQSKALVFARKLQDSAAAQAKAKLQKISEKSPRLEEENDADEDKGVASDSDSSSSSGGDDDGLHDSNARNKQIPWQLGKPSGPCTEKYQRGDGIDVYIDGAMFLPDNCTTSRVVAKVYSSESEQIGESYVAYADPSSPATSPLYNFKIELRSAGFDVTSTVVVRIDSIDSTTLESSAVCYSCFKLFATRERVQPKQMNEANIFINTGAFQLPAKGNRLSKAQDKFDDTILNKLPRVPCASLLVRVLSAPKGSGGLGVLSREDHPKDEWGKLGLDVPMPVYSTGMYDGQLCEPTALEKVGFVAKMVGPTQTVDAALQSAINAARGCVENTTASGNVTKFPPRPTGVNASDHEKLAKWIKSLYAPADKIRTLLDYTYAVPYSADSGLSIAVDGLIHMQDISGMFSSSINMYKVIYSICPPSVFYMNPPLTNENVRFTRQNDLDCPIKMAKFTDGYSSFSPPLIASESGATGGGNGSADSLWLVLDVRTIKIDPPKAKFPKDEPVITIEAATDLDVYSKIKPGSNAIKSYWTILPLFKEKIPGQGYRYVSTGNFILPLIEGSVPGDILSAPDPFKETLSRLGGHKATVATTVGTASGKNTPVRISPDGSSVLIRVANPQITQLQAKLGKEELEPAAMNRTVMNKMLNAENLATGAIKHNLYVWESAKYAKSKLLTDLLAVYDAKKVLKTVNKLFAEATSIM